MSSAAADFRKKSQKKKKLIAGITLILLLLLVSLLGGLSSQMAPTGAATSLQAPPAAGPLAVPPLPPRRPRSVPLAVAGPPPTLAEEILMEIDRYGGSGVADSKISPPPDSDSLSPDSPAPEDYPWPVLPHDRPLQPPLLAKGAPPWLVIANGGPPVDLPGNEPGKPAAPVPEPATLFLVGTGLACLARLGRRRPQSA